MERVTCFLTGWLHTQEMWYGKDNMIEINWTKKTLLVIRKS
jgi:hypothetical protein